MVKMGLVSCGCSGDGKYDDIDDEMPDSDVLKNL